MPQVTSTVDRVLPWRRSAPPPAEEVAPLLAAFRARHGRSVRTDMISRAYLAAAAAHDGQMRKTGEAYIHHPIAVARIVAELGLDDVTIAAALLHDAVEDTGMTLADVEAQFGVDVAAIVDGVTKLDRLSFDTKEEQQAATVRKMIVAMSKDLRVLIIKLADRLHNMRTIAGMPTFKQERTARETLDIFAPLAHRLGMQDVRQQLEDLSFAALHPKRFAEIDHMVSTRTPERELYLHQVIDQVQRAARRAAAHGRGHRAAEAPVEHLREDGGQGPRVRRHLRPRRHPGHRRLRQGLLRRARLHPRHLEAGAGTVQGLHRHAQVQPLPVVAHDGGGSAGQAPRGPDPDHARCTPGPSGVSPPTGSTSRARRSGRPARTTPGCHGSSTGRRRPPTPASS